MALIDEFENSIQTGDSFQILRFNNREDPGAFAALNVVGGGATLTTTISNTQVELSVAAAARPAVPTGAAKWPQDAESQTAPGRGSHPLDVDRITSEESNLLGLIARDIERFKARKRIAAKAALRMIHEMRSSSSEDSSASIDALLAGPEWR